MKHYIYIILFICSFSLVYAQGSAGSAAKFESRYIVEMPTAGILPKSDYVIYGTAFADGGLFAEFTASPFTNFELGLSFSGIRIIGSGDMDFQKIPGVNIKWRIINETSSFPAIAIGANIQGKGYYSKTYDRFQTQSPGIYVSGSKDMYWYLGYIAFHGGLNYSFEPSPYQRKINLYAGFEQSLGRAFSVNCEYNANLDDENKHIMKNKGLLNLAIRASLSKGVTLELQLKDLLKNLKSEDPPMRVFGLEYVSRF